MTHINFSQLNVTHKNIRKIIFSDSQVDDNILLARSLIERKYTQNCIHLHILAVIFHQ